MKLLTASQIVKDEIVRILCYNEPYGQLVIAEGKDETRRYATNVRGWVLVATCAKAYSERTIKAISGSQFERVQSHRKPYDLIWKDENKKPTGLIIGITKLINCRPMEKKDEKKTFVEYRPGIYVWEFDHDCSYACAPVLHKGKQGWAFAKPELLKQLQFNPNSETITVK